MFDCDNNFLNDARYYPYDIRHNPIVHEFNLQISEARSEAIASRETIDRQNRIMLEQKHEIDRLQQILTSWSPSKETPSKEPEECLQKKESPSDEFTPNETDSPNSAAS